jgi:hypothetical protein
LKEYGSSIQKLVNNMVTIEDREKRTRYAHILVELMRQIHPNMKDGQDYYNKLWDDLYIISGFTLDVDSPYPPPSEEALGKAPQRVLYNTHPRLRFKHFGHNMDLLVTKAGNLEDADERRAFVSYLTRLMKTFYQAWNKEAVEDETIFQSLIEMSNGKLYDDIQLIRQEGLVESTPRERTEGQQPRQGGNQNFRQNTNNGGSSRNEGNSNAGGRNYPRGNSNGGGRNEGNNRQNNGGGNGGGRNEGNNRGNNAGGSGGRSDFRNNNQRNNNNDRRRR